MIFENDSYKLKVVMNIIFSACS